MPSADGPGAVSPRRSVSSTLPQPRPSNGSDCHRAAGPVYPSTPNSRISTQVPANQRGTIERAALSAVLALALPGCGGETRTTTVTVTEPAGTDATPQVETSTSAATSTGSEKASDDAIEVEQTKLVYIDGASGGPFHTAL